MQHRVTLFLATGAPDKMRALLVAALALAGCAQPMHGPEYGLVGVILRISYDAVFQPDDVATAAARLGWRTENGTSPAGFGAVVVESPELTLRAYRAHSGDAVWERGWWLEATFRLPEPLPAASVW
jgi:hypothetical protein